MKRSARNRLLEELYGAALAGVEPASLVARALARPKVAAALRRARRLGVFAVGKAAGAMLLGARGLAPRGLAVLPRGVPSPRLPGVEVLHSSHPEPDRSSVRAARRALAFFADFGPGDLLLCLVSGGTSSLLAMPRGVTLTAKKRAVARLAASGASILEINRLRASLSAVKGGRLGRATRARLVTLVLSDVPGDLPAAVGSGPTIRKRKGDLVLVVGSNRTGLEAAARRARRLGLSPRIRRERLRGEARLAGAAFARRARRLSPGEALLEGGETTVALAATPRECGGRCLEFGLGAAAGIAGERNLALLAAGSDGRDGSSPAAGAFADGETLLRARRLGLDPAAAVRRHATDAFFRRLGDLVETGPTGTNVADWAFAVRTPEEARGRASRAPRRRRPV